MLSFAVSIAVTIGLVYYAFMQMEIMNNQTKVISENWLHSVYYVSDMNTNTSDIRLWQLQHASTTSDAEMKEVEKQIKEVLNKFNSNKAAYIPLISSEVEKREWPIFEAKWNDYMELHKEFLKLSHQNFNDSARMLLNGEMKDHHDEACIVLLKLVDENKLQSDNEAIQCEKIYNNARQTMMYALILAVLLLAVIIIFVVRIITGTLNNIKTVAEKVAKGDFNATVDINQTDEIGAVGAAVKTIVANLQSFQTELNELVLNGSQGKLTARSDAKKFEGGYAQIIKGVNELMDTLTNPLNVTSAYIQKISIGEMPPQITDTYYGDFNQIKNNLNLLISATNDIVEKAKLMSKGDLMVDLKKRSEKDDLMQALNEMVKAMVNVVSEVQNAADNVADGSSAISSSAQEMTQGATEQSASVEEVLASIEEMAASINQNTDNAQQTDRIAQKAADAITEGSKAVEFTIKAMREIAQKITVITDIAEKTDLLAINAAIEAARAGEHGEGFAVVASEVRKLAEMSQHAAKEITQTAQASVETAENSGTLLKNIVPDIQKTARLVQEIAAASLEQNAGTKQINSAINQLNTVSQQNASSAEELSSSAEELTSQAEQLKEVISFFKIEGKKNYMAKAKQYKSTNKAKHFTPQNKGVNLHLTDNDNTDSEFQQI